MILSESPFITFVDCSLPRDMLQSLLDVKDFAPAQVFKPSFLKKTFISDGRKSYTALLDDSNFSQVKHHLLNFIMKTYGHQYSIEQAEPLQITQYDTGGEYKVHTDYFYEYSFHHYRKLIPNAKHLATKKDRIATIILYLNDDFEGGTTDFPKLKISVKPVTGNILYFTYPEKNDAAQKTLHAGTVVTKGTKKILTLWIKE